MNIDKWIQHKRRSVIEVYDLEVRARMAEGILSEIDEKVREVMRVRDMTAPKVVAAEAVSNSTAGHDGWDWAFAAAGVFVADVGAWYFTRRSSMPDLSVLEAFLVALLAAGLLALLFHSVARLGLTVRFNAEATIRRHRLAGWISGGVATISGLLILVSSYLAPELIGAVLALGWVPFVGLNIGGPACAGVCSSAAWYLLKPDALKYKHGRAAAALAGLAEFRAWLETEARGRHQKPAGSRESFPRRSRSGRGRGRSRAEVRSGRVQGYRSTPAGMKVVTMLIVGVTPFVGGTTRGGLPSETIVVTAEQSDTAEGTCALFVDATATVNNDARREAIAFIMKTLWSLIEEYGCNRVVAGTFTEDGPWTERTWFDPVPCAPVDIDCERQFEEPDLDCSAAEPEPLRGVLAGYGLFGNVRELRKRQAIEACERVQQERQLDRDQRAEICRTDQRQEKERYEADRASFTRGVGAALAVSEPQTNVTTEIVALLNSLLAADGIRLVVLVTDALDSAWQTTGKVPPIAVPAQRAVVMVVTEPNPDYAERSDVLAAVQAWRSAIPPMAIVLTSELDDRMWVNLAGIGQ